jgi:dihydroorotate dehydrogenase (NAD+) catalytic subunit
MGGIQYWQDAVEFMLAGATAVAVGTALFVDPNTPMAICEGLGQYMEKMKVERVSDLVGALRMPGDQAVSVGPYP